MPAHATVEAVIAVAVVFTTLGLAAICGRILAGVREFGKVKVGDVFIVISAVFSVATAVALCLAGPNGMIIPQSRSDRAESIGELKLTYVAFLTYNLSLLAVKISISLQCLGASFRRRWRVTSWILLGIFAASTCATSSAALFSCWPIASIWQGTEAGGAHCIDRQTFWMANACIDLVADIAILILSALIVHQLHLSKRQKRAFLAVFGIGGLTCSASILRLVAICMDSRRSWGGILLAICSLVEINTALLCSCLPTLRPLLATIPQICDSLHDDSAGDSEPHPGERVSLTLQALHPSSGDQETKSIISLGAFSRKLSTRQSSFRPNHSSLRNSLDLLSSRAPSPENIPDGMILVETVMEQEIERRGEVGDVDSMLHLIQEGDKHVVV